MTDSTKKRKISASAEPKPMSDEELAVAIGKLPPGTKETRAFETIPHGRTREAFRHVWLHDHLGVVCSNEKASVEADVATGGDGE